VTSAVSSTMEMNEPPSGITNLLDMSDEPPSTGLTDSFDRAGVTPSQFPPPRWIARASAGGSGRSLQISMFKLTRFNVPVSKYCHRNACYNSRFPSYAVVAQVEFTA
jgi:hypothetical protein